MSRLLALFLLGFPVLAASTVDAQDLELTVFFLEADDLQASPGDRLEVEYSVRNNGPEDLNFGIGFYLSEDDAFSSSDLFLEGEGGDVDAGQTERDTEQMDLPDSVAPGCYFVLGFVDNQNGIDETDETNNLRAAPVAVDRTVEFCANQTAAEDDARAGWGVETAAPNPVANASSVTYRLGRAASARLDVIDALGRTVATLADGAHAAGEHRATLDAAALPAGVYALRLRADGRTWTQAVTVVR